MAKASPTQAWLWHRKLSYLNFDYINLLSKKDVVISLPKLKNFKDQLCSSCEVSKAKRSSFKTKIVSSSKGRLNLLHMNLCGPIRRNRASKTASTPQSPEQEWRLSKYKIELMVRLLELTMLSIQRLNLPLVLSAESICNCKSILKTDLSSLDTLRKWHFTSSMKEKPAIKQPFNIFGCTCYLTRDGENLDKIKEKGDPCILAGYSTQPRSPTIKEASRLWTTSGLRPTTTNFLSFLLPANTTFPSQQEVFFLVRNPLFVYLCYDEFFNTGTSSVNKSSSPTDNSVQQDTLPTTNIHPTTEPSTLTDVHAEENNDNQVGDTQHEYNQSFSIQTVKKC
ncbi:retrovirus-related pol polyprotein from transposon TNT 1-94 [Tanacetum coccineum]